MGINSDISNISDLSNLSTMISNGMKISLQEDFSPYIGLIVLPTFAMELALACLAYRMRLRIESAVLAEKEFDICQQKVYFINILVCGGLLGYPGGVPIYQNSFTHFLVAVSRLIAAVLSTPILMLYRKNELNIIHYFERRFNSVIFTHLFIITGMAGIVIVMNMSIKSFYQSIEAFGLDPLVCLTVLFIYSAIITALGGLRGIIWLGALRFYLILVFKLILVIICSVKLSEHIPFSKFGTGIKTNAFSINAFTTIIPYYVTLNLSVIIGKYFNAVSKDSYAWWFCYLVVIPQISISTITDGLYILVSLYYSKVGCDPVSAGAVSRELLFYQFLSDISENAASLQLMFGFCEYWFGSFSILDNAMTSWYYLSYLSRRVEKSLFPQTATRTSRFHIMIMGTAVIMSFYAFLHKTNEKSLLWWLPKFWIRYSAMSSVTVMAIMLTSAVFPQMSSLTLWIIPLQICATLIATITSGKFFQFGVEISSLCFYENTNCTVPCIYTCTSERSKDIMIIILLSLLAGTFGTLLVSYFSRKSYRNLDQDLYVKGAIRYWSRLYMRRRKKVRRPWISLRQPRVL